MDHAGNIRDPPGSTSSERCLSGQDTRQQTAQRMRRTQRDASTHRRLMEKRGRERVSQSLKELKRLLPNFRQQGSKTGEQMDLLQSAVDYLKSVQTSSSAGQHSWTNDTMKSTASSGEGPLPSLFNPPPAPVDAMMDGYEDCMEETIRYLVQVEGFPPNHDIILRLRAHLLQYRSKLDLNNQLRTRRAGRAALSQYYGLQLQQQQQERNIVGFTQGDSNSTQASPQLAHTNACAAYPPGSAMLARNGASQDALHSKTVSSSQGGSPQLPLGMMKPLTVDTNQYYAMPSPLSHCLTTESALMIHNSTESLLTIARTIPTNSGVTFSSPGLGLTTVTCSNTSSTVGRTVPRSVPSTQSIAPSMANNVSGSHLGFNLNYVAPYLVAFVRPAAQ